MPHTGKVEGVDVHRRAFERHADVLPDERAALGQRLHARRRRTRGCSAARACPCSRTRTACRCRRRCRSRNRPWWRRWRTTAGRTPPCAPSRSLASALSCAARSWKVRRRRFGPPTRRACSSIAPISRPSAVALAITLAGGGIAQRDAVARARLPPAGDKTLKLHERCSCSAGDLPLDAVGAAAEQRDALAALIADHDFVNAVALGAPRLAGLGRELIALARRRPGNRCWPPPPRWPRCRSCRRRRTRCRPG